MKTNVKYRVNYPTIIRNIIILVLLIVFANAFLFPIIGRADIKTEKITVSKNDTLWKIASSVIDNSDCENLDVGRVIYDIKNINNMENSTIYQGETINVPIYE